MSNLNISIVTLSERIAIIRKNKKLTQKDFSSALNVSRSYISEVENKNKKPSIEMLMGINRHFGDINPDWLLSGKGSMFLNEKPDKAQAPKWFTNWWQHADDEHRTWLKIQLKQTPPNTK